mgnify:CR=1 FL=1
MKTYTYKDNIYNNLYDLSEAMGQDGTFIPLSISDADLGCLGVVMAEAEEPIENIRTRKIIELKRQRDAAEVEPIEYDGHLYDYDSKARDRIAAAIIALDVMGANTSIVWTTADNQDIQVTANDLRMVIAMVAQRSNALHVAYRAAKDKVEAATTVADVETITLNL